MNVERFTIAGKATCAFTSVYYYTHPYSRLSARILPLHQNAQDWTWILDSPIVAYGRQPTAKRAWLMTRILKPLLVNFPARLESSYWIPFDRRQQACALRSVHPYPMSLEVSALYASDRSSSRSQQSSRDPNTHQLSRKRVHPRSVPRKQPPIFTASVLL